jgi:hypothetical protein
VEVVQLGTHAVSRPASLTIELEGE